MSAMRLPILFISLLSLVTHTWALLLVGPTSPPTVTYKDYDLENSPTRAGPDNVVNLAEGRDDMFLRYIPDKNVVLCACAKCGTTSLFQYAYELAFGKSWVSMYNETEPWPQEVLSERWDNKMRIVNETAEQDQIMKSAYSIAVIRDPKERLISAWKSKLACDDSYGVDSHDRSYFVHDSNHTAWPRGFVFGFQKLYGAEENITCLTLPMFVDGLLAIKSLGRSKYLDRHFLPQDEGCFLEYPAEKWSRVAPISYQGAFDELSEKMGSKSKPMLWTHASTQVVYVSEEVSHKLDLVTEDEYKMLAPYLSTGYTSPVSSGYYFTSARAHPLLPSL